MSWLVFGRSGQVARELADLLPDAVFLGRDEADLRRPEECAARVRDHRPDAVINAAGYTAVDAAETDGAAQSVNAEAPGAMARAAAELGVPFIHISTDYVFDGRGAAPFAPGDTPAPLNVYGRTKLAGESAVRAAGGVHAILRTSWIFSAHGSNFLKTMLRLSDERPMLDIVADQVGGPTPARALARACIRVADTLSREPEKTGTYHYAGQPDVSWADFARAIFAASGRDVAVRGISTSEWPTPARRPLNSRLDCRATEDAFGLPRPNWREDLRQTIAELRAQT